MGGDKKNKREEPILYLPSCLHGHSSKRKAHLLSLSTPSSQSWCRWLAQGPSSCRVRWLHPHLSLFRSVARVENWPRLCNSSEAFSPLLESMFSLLFEQRQTQSMLEYL